MNKASKRSMPMSNEDNFQSFHRLMDNVGVPKDTKWRSAILFMRSIKDYSIYSDDQKKRVQALVLEVLKDKRFAESDFYSVERKMHDILSESWKIALHDELKEISKLIMGTKAMMLQRKGDLEALETTTVETLQGSGSLDDAVRLIRHGFQEMITLMEEDTAKLIEQSMTDPLTGLGNRRALDALINELAEERGEGADRTSLLGALMVDVDYFKKFNDVFGHPVGDRVLVAVASVLRGLQQQYRTPRPRVVPFRYGGEEFVVVASGLSLNQLRELAETIRAAIETYRFAIQEVDGTTVSSGVKITVSIGVSCQGDVCKGPGGWDLLTIADECLYLAKMRGRNQVVCAMPSF